MGLRRPTCTVTINGVATPFFEYHGQHSVDAPVAQASIVMPSPPPANVFEDAKVVVILSGDTGEDAETLFEGRIRGPIDRRLSESDATVTARCDGNLWRMTFPASADLSWVGPITPRKVLRQLLAFCGVERAHVEQFVHPTKGIPILLGGVPWFDDGRVILTAGTTPLAFAERICRLFGYRIYDRPDGRVRVTRVNGKPPETGHTFTEGVDLLNVSGGSDLHPIVTYWEAQGATGSDPAGQQVAVVSRPRRGVRSHFIPNPPKYAGGSVSDSLLVTQQLADAARISKELDFAGVAWNVSGEAIGATYALSSLNPRQGFRVISPTLDLDEKRFWQTGVQHDWGAGGYWTTIEGWRPTGKRTRTEKPDPPDTDPRDPPPADEVDPEPDPLPETYDVDPEAPEYDPLTDPDGDQALEVPPEPAFVQTCCPPPTAPARVCETVPLLEPDWDTEVTDIAPLVEAFSPPIAADALTVNGEVLGGPGTVEVWQNGVLAGSAVLPAGVADVWTAFSVVVPGAVLAVDEAEVRVLIGGA